MREKGQSVIVLPLLLGWMAAAVLAASPAPHAPSEPSVSPREYELIQAALETASSDPSLTLRMLQDANRPEASAALDALIGNVLLEAGELEEAASAYQAALSKFPGYRSAAANLGRVYLLQDRPEEAVALYRDWVQDGRADGDLLMMLGLAWLNLANPWSAEIAFRQALLLATERVEVKLGLLQALQGQGRHAEVLALCSELLRVHPLRADVWTLRVETLLALGRFDEAALALEQSRRLGCADAGMLALLGDLYVQRDQPEDALRMYERSFDEQRPPLNRILHAVEGLLSLGDLSGAERMIARTEELPDAPGPEDSVRWTRLQVEIARRQGDLDRAIRLGREGLRSDPLDGSLLLLLARLLEQAGEIEEARMLCERAARVPGQEAEALIQQANLEIARERYEPALRLLEAALRFRDEPPVRRSIERLRVLVRHGTGS